MTASALGPAAPAIFTDAQGALVGDDPAIAGDARVLEFHRYWQSLRGTRRFPARRDVEPTSIPHFLSGILLLDVHYDPLDFEYRLIGGDIVARTGSLKGKRVREAALRNPESTVYENYCRLIASGVPQFLRGHAVSVYLPSRKIAVARVHCPLSSDGAVIDKVISYFAFLER